MKINSINIGNIYSTAKDQKIKKNETKQPLTSYLKDELNISQDGDNLHKLAVKSNEILSSIENVKKDELSKIKEKVENGYYQKDNVINSIASSILDDSEFQQLFMKDEMIQAVEEYIDLRENDIKKIDSSKMKVLEKNYQKYEVYEKVADEIIDIYT